MSEIRVNEQKAPPPIGRVGLREHPLRLELAGEVHARPYEVLEPPVRVTHLAVAGGEGSAAADRAHLCDLLDRFGVAPPPDAATHFAQSLGPVRLRWERHTEFSTYTFYRFDEMAGDPFGDKAIDLVPDDWLAGLPGELLVAVHAAIRPGDAQPDLAAIFGNALVVGSRIGGGDGAAWSDFRLHGDGFGRILIHAGTLSRGQVGRYLQRLLELETYRMMALLAFPTARQMGPQLSRLERNTATLTAHMAEPAAGIDDRDLLGQLTLVAAEVERLMAAHSYRFGASHAYQAIVERSLGELREDRIPGSQTFTDFFDRRFAPAMRTVEAMATRADALGRRVARTADLLRTRVDIAMEENNRDLLESMNRRARLQLQLQETVEGLSVVAISYYGWGLLAYLLKGAKANGLPIDPDKASLIAVPLVVVVVWLLLGRLKKAVGHGEA